MCQLFSFQYPSSSFIPRHSLPFPILTFSITFSRVLKSLALLAILFLAPSLAWGQARYDTQYTKPTATGGLTAVSGLASVCTSLATTAASVSGNVATLTMASNPLTAGFVNGRNILVVNFAGGDSYFNQTSATLTGVTSTTISYALTHGNATAASNASVVQYQTAAAACAPAATVYSDSLLTLTLTQPFSDDGKGNVGWFAAPGLYYAGYFASGISPLPLNTVTLSPTAPINLATQTTGQVNLATQVSGTLPGANMAAVNLAAAGNGGVTGILPLANIGPLQGTDTSLLTAGTVSASAGVGLCTDANHGATTSGCTPGGVAEFDWSMGATTGTTLSFTNSACTSTLNVACLYTVFPSAHKLVRVTLQLVVSPSGCSTQPQVGLIDITSTAIIGSITIVNGASTGFTDSGALSVSMTAGHEFAIGIVVAESGCGTAGSMNGLTAVLQ